MLNNNLHLAIITTNQLSTMIFANHGYYHLVRALLAPTNIPPFLGAPTASNPTWMMPFWKYHAAVPEAARPQPSSRPAQTLPMAGHQ